MVKAIRALACLMRIHCRENRDLMDVVLAEFERCLKMESKRRPQTAASS